MNFKFESSAVILRKITQLNTVIILKSTNEYYLKKWLQIGPLSCYDSEVEVAV